MYALFAGSCPTLGSFSKILRFRETYKISLEIPGTKIG